VQQSADMSERRILGKIEMTCYSQVATDRVQILTEVQVESAHPDISDLQLRSWARDELTRAGDAARSSAPVPRSDLHPAGFDWPSVFSSGDVVRHRTDDQIGIVLKVVNYSSDTVPLYELHVDIAEAGVPTGIGCWAPWVAYLSNDAESIDRVRKLGLRGLG
jgi:hypothetical protein